MFDIGFSELLLLGAIALIFIGPKQLPEVARGIARFINELKRATGDLGSVMDLHDQTKNVLKETRDSIAKSLLETKKTEDKKPVDPAT